MPRDLSSRTMALLDSMVGMVDRKGDKVATVLRGGDKVAMATVLRGGDKVTMGRLLVGDSVGMSTGNIM